MIHLNPISQAPTNDRTTYWLDLWDEQLRLYLLHPDGFAFTTGSILLDILIEETATEHSRSGTIRRLILDSLSRLRRAHPLFRSSQLGSDLGLILTDYQQKQSPLVNVRASALRDLLDSRDYSFSIVSYIASLLEHDKDFTNQELRDLIELTCDAIGRLLRHGFSVDTALQIPGRLFSGVTGDAQKHSSFPRHYLKLDASGTLGERRSWVPLSPEECTAIDALDTRARVLTLAEYMHAEPVLSKCYYAVDGLSGVTRQEIGRVIFYSPATESLLPEGSRLPSGINKAELFGRDLSLNPITACVEVPALDQAQANDKARAILDDTLNVFNLASPPPPTIEVRRWPWLYVNPYGLGLYGTIGKVEPAPDNLYFTTKQLETIVSEIGALHAPNCLIEGDVPESGIEHEIATALYWLRRAEQSSRVEDRLLFNWLTFDKLFVDPRPATRPIKAISTVEDVITTFYPTIDMYTLALQLTELPVIYLDAFWGRGLSRNQFPRLSREALQTLLGDDGVATSEDFNRALNENLDKIRPGRLKARLFQYLNDMDEPKSTQSVLSQYIERTARDMSVIYWLRNRLVHGGEFTFPALGYFVGILYAGNRTMLRIVADKRNWPQNARHPLDVFLAMYFDATRLLQSLRDGTTTVREFLKEARIFHPEFKFDFGPHNFVFSSSLQTKG